MLLFSLPIIYGQVKITIKGRVIDNLNNPLKMARITLFPAKQNGSKVIPIHNDIIETVETNNLGEFSIKMDKSFSTKMLLYITSYTPNNYHMLLDPPFESVQGKQIYTGKLVSIRSNKDILLGDLPVNVYFGTIDILFINNEGVPFFNLEPNLLGFRVRLLDKAENTIYESIITFPSAYVFQDRYHIALPKGLWKLEFEFISKEDIIATSSICVNVIQSSNIKITSNVSIKNQLK
jgi:hypothetical protein